MEPLDLETLLRSPAVLDCRWYNALRSARSTFELRHLCPARGFALRLGAPPL